VSAVQDFPEETTGRFPFLSFPLKEEIKALFPQPLFPAIMILTLRTGKGSCG
jgi:hypothetical protein